PGRGHSRREADCPASHGPKRHGAVGQPSLSRLAGLRNRRDQLYRPRHLGRPKGHLRDQPRPRSISQTRTAIAVPTAVPISTPFIGLRISSPTRKPARMPIVRKQPPARVVFEAITPPQPILGI